MFVDYVPTHRNLNKVPGRMVTRAWGNKRTKGKPEPILCPKQNVEICLFPGRKMC